MNTSRWTEPLLIESYAGPEQCGHCGRPGRWTIEQAGYNGDGTPPPGPPPAVACIDHLALICEHLR